MNVCNKFTSQVYLFEGLQMYLLLHGLLSKRMMNSKSSEEHQIFEEF